jgi:hypothetical protein
VGWGGEKRGGRDGERLTKREGEEREGGGKEGTVH